VVSVIVPTRGRPAYLEAALASIVPQAVAAGGEVVVVADVREADVVSVVRRHGARLVAHPAPGANAARITGMAATDADLLVLVDDDVEAPPSWLAALLAAADAHPGWDVIGGPIVPRLEGARARGCGRDRPPVTGLDLGPRDVEAAAVWTANLLVRRSALALAGLDPDHAFYGEEEEWQRRLRARGGRIGYAAAGGLVHRRAGPDARPWALTRASWAQGRGARRWDGAKGRAPGVAAEAVLVGRCLGHAARRRCAWGLYTAAHAGGRLREALGA